MNAIDNQYIDAMKRYASFGASIFGANKEIQKKIDLRILKEDGNVVVDVGRATSNQSALSFEQLDMLIYESFKETIDNLKPSEDEIENFKRRKKELLKKIQKFEDKQKHIYSQDDEMKEFKEEMLDLFALSERSKSMPVGEIPYCLYPVPMRSEMV